MTTSSILQCKVSNTELLNLYGYEPLPDGGTVRSRWDKLSSNWVVANSPELSELRQTMLQIHLELCPEDERWVHNTDTAEAYNKYKALKKAGNEPSLLQVQQATADYLNLQAAKKAGKVDG